ncbi:MAG: single-stranded DNA-binding protein [Bryobacteraceae bacterium]|nr:single-stranded DNA-binding protein [Bryobacteraceae bacterium]
MASRSVNKVILIGNLGKDAETKFAPSGTAKTTFSIATSRRWKDQATGDWKEETDWHNIVLWKSENLANYLQKGKQVFIEGRLTTRSWDDKDGNKKWMTEVVADNVILLGQGGGGGEGGGGSRSSSYDDSEFGSGGGGGPVSMPRSARREPAAPTQSTGGSFEPGITDDDVPF